MSEDNTNVIILDKDYDEEDYEITYKCLRDKDGHRRYVFNVKRIEKNKVMYCDRNICTQNEYNGIGCSECEVTKSQEEKQSPIELCYTCAHSEKSSFGLPCKHCSHNNLSFSTIQHSYWEQKEGEEK